MERSTILYSITLFIDIKLTSHIKGGKQDWRCVRTGCSKKCFVIKKEVLDRWRKLHNDQFRIFFSSMNIFRFIKSSTPWVGHVEYLVLNRYVYRIVVGESDRIKRLRAILTRGTNHTEGDKRLRWLLVGSNELIIKPINIFNTPNAA
jgi:hypothetical protein